MKKKIQTPTTCSRGHQFNKSSERPVCPTCWPGHYKKPYAGIQDYNKALAPTDKKICDTLAAEITRHLPKAENKIWHRHPVWFLDGNPVVGYSKLKSGIRLMFWSGRGFDEPLLLPGEGRFKDASITYTSAREINEKDIKRWLKKSVLIQWDYKNIVKRKGVLKKIP